MTIDLSEDFPKQVSVQKVGKRQEAIRIRRGTVEERAEKYLMQWERDIIASIFPDWPFLKNLRMPRKDFSRGKQRIRPLTNRQQAWICSAVLSEEQKTIINYFFPGFSPLHTPSLLAASHQHNS